MAPSAYDKAAAIFMVSPGALTVPVAVPFETVPLPTAIAGAAAAEPLACALACALGCPHAPQNALSSATAAPHFVQFAMSNSFSFVSFSCQSRPVAQLCTSPVFLPL